MNKRAFAISGIVLAALAVGFLTVRSTVPDRPFHSETWKKVSEDRTSKAIKFDDDGNVAEAEVMQD